MSVKNLIKGVNLKQIIVIKRGLNCCVVILLGSYKVGNVNIGVKYRGVKKLSQIKYLFKFKLRTTIPLNDIKNFCQKWLVKKSKFV